MRKAAPLPCEICGQVVVKKKRPDRRVLCWECSVQVMADAARQMSDKSGPVWEAWCASNAAGAPGRPSKPEE